MVRREKMREIPSGFRQCQQIAGIWAVNREAFFDELTPREGQERAFEAVGKLLDKKLKMVFLVGESRSGKSWFCSAYVNHLLKDQYNRGVTTTVKYMTFFDFELALRSAQTLGTMDKLFDRMVGYPQLVIDELGRGKWSEFTSTFFMNVLIRRHGENKETLVGTNLSGAEVKEMLDLAVLERIKEDGAIILMKK